MVSHRSFSSIFNVNILLSENFLFKGEGSGKRLKEQSVLGVHSFFTQLFMLIPNSEYIYIFFSLLALDYYLLFHKDANQY